MSANNSNSFRTPPRRTGRTVPETPLRIRRNGTLVRERTTPINLNNTFNAAAQNTPDTKAMKNRYREAQKNNTEQKKMIQALINKYKTNNNNKNNMNKTLNLNSMNFNEKLRNFKEPVYILSDAIYNGKIMRIYEKSYLEQMLKSGKSFFLSPQTNFPFKSDYVKSYPPTETNIDKIKKLHIDRSDFIKQRKQIIKYFGGILGGEWDYNIIHFFPHIEGKYKKYHFEFIDKINKITKRDLQALLWYPSDIVLQMRGQQLIEYSLRRQFRPNLWEFKEKTIIKIQKIIKKLEEDISKRNNKTNHDLHTSLRKLLLMRGSNNINLFRN